MSLHGELLRAKVHSRYFKAQGLTTDTARNFIGPELFSECTFAGADLYRRGGRH
jgi:hypothetical protein